MAKLRIQLSALMVRASALAVTSALIAGSALAQEREAFFGETHVHTGWSFDAYIFGNHKSSPADAYKYAKGQPIKHPLGYDIKIETPLDWMGVTDHSEYVGTVALANTPGSEISKLPIAEKLIVHSPADIQRIYLWLGGTIIDKKPIEQLISPEVAGSVWKQNNDMANAANEPGKFTAFCSYEWTSTPNNRNMHRNVFFKDCAKVPEMPFSSIDSSDPSDLWNWMDRQRQAGNELLAISHNANLSDGHMFPTDIDEKGRPIDAAWAESRDRNERLTEIKQVKGASETHPALSPNDEFANFEILTYLLGDPAGRFPHVPGSYIRQALKDGLSMQEARGYNPYKMGFVGGSDSHNTGVPYRQTNFFGAHGLNDGEIKQRMSGYVFAGLDVRLENPAGLTGIWAEENTRASLFDGMARKETFGTSGPQIKVRMFGGADMSAATSDGPDWVQAAYANGVPMGGDLPPLGEARAPSFVVWALKDPTSGNLDRIQIVKGWSKHGQSFEKVFDVAWAGSRAPDPFTGTVPPIGSTVNLEDATYTNTIGGVELKGHWTDPEFDPGLDAFYYARVLEIPTPRWTTIQARELGIAPPTNVAATIQERAWSSPIWYSPAPDARSADKGVTVASLESQGATALDEAALNDLIVGKTTWVRNTVTGDIFSITWTSSGQRLIGNVNGDIPKPDEVGDVLHGGAIGAGTAYAIKDGAIVTTLGNTPYEVKVYKQGDKYLAARGNEFGFANYEIVPTPHELDPLNQAKSPF